MTIQLAAVTTDEAEVYQTGGEPVEETEVQNEAVEVDGDGDGDGDKTAPDPAEPTESTGWEAEALEQIKQARVRVAMMEGRYLEAKERAKDCKTSWEAAVEELTQVIDAATKPLPLFDRPATTGAADTPTDPTDEAWRETPISEIFLGIRGLGAKKREAIVELIPTLGAFEDLRKKASLDGEPLREYMPKGIGQDACDQLEEAALNWVSAHFYPADDEDEGDEAGE